MQGLLLPVSVSGSAAQLIRTPHPLPRSPCPCAQIRPAVLRNYAKYIEVLLKPWYPSAEEQWTAGAKGRAWAVGW